MIQFYFHLGPNPMKVALFLEEAELSYEPRPVDSRKGEQHSPEYRAINPNGKVPSIIDGETVVFDSTAILLYLAEKTGKFLPDNAHRGELLSWLMFLSSGVGPFSGQSVHYHHYIKYIKEGEDYSLNRYDFEANRHWSIVEERLAKHPYMVADQYSIADMAVWGWARIIPYVFDLPEAEAWSKFPNVQRLVKEIDSRAAAARVADLKARYSFKSDWDADAQKNMFPQLARISL